MTPGPSAPSPQWGQVSALTLLCRPGRGQPAPRPSGSHCLGGWEAVRCQVELRFQKQDAAQASVSPSFSLVISGKERSQGQRAQ